MCIIMCFLCVDVCGNSLLFFFSSRRRHTRSLRDWSSDVCSSDLALAEGHVTHGISAYLMVFFAIWWAWMNFRSEERRVGKSVDLGGRRIIKKKKKIDI